jgi:hypothetical protein
VGLSVAAIVAGLSASCANLNNLTSGPGDATIEAEQMVSDAAPPVDDGGLVEAACSKGSGCLTCCYAAEELGARFFALAVWSCLCPKGVCVGECADAAAASCTQAPMAADVCADCLDVHGVVQCYDDGTYGCPDSGAGAAECRAYGACALACGK